MGFNKSKRNTVSPGYVPETTTYEGGPGYFMTPELELFVLVGASLFSGDSYYEGDEERKGRFYSLVEEVISRNPSYVADLAIYARRVLGLRSGPSAMVAHLFWSGPKEEATRASRGVWVRGDEHLETLAYTLANGWKVKSSLKRAVANRMNSLSPFALVKYACRNCDVSQADAVRLTHPKPKDEAHSMVYRYLSWQNSNTRRRLPEEWEKATVYVRNLMFNERPTWERILSLKGSTAEAWREAVPHLRGLSLLRNLNNLLKHGLLNDPEVVSAVVRGITETVSDPFILPYHYVLPIIYAKEADSSSTLPPPIVRTLEEAIHKSAMFVPERLALDTVVLLDYSGSMVSPISANSKATLLLVATSLAYSLFLRGATVYAFSNDVYRIDRLSNGGRTVNPYSLSELYDYLVSRANGTYLGKALSVSLQQAEGAKRVIIITDEQAHDDSYSPLTKWLSSHPERRAYVINVGGYMVSAFPEIDGQIVRLSGYSDRLLDFIDTLEEAFRDPVAGVRQALSRYNLL